MAPLMKAPRAMPQYSHQALRALTLPQAHMRSSPRDQNPSDRPGLLLQTQCHECKRKKNVFSVRPFVFNQNLHSRDMFPSDFLAVLRSVLPVYGYHTWANTALATTAIVLVRLDGLSLHRRTQPTQRATNQSIGRSLCAMPL